MPFLLDAYNVLHCCHVLPGKWSEVDVRGLCKLIDRAGPKGGARVVCDGAPPKLADLHEMIGDVHLIYAGGGKDADSLIEKLIEAEGAPRELVVVSNDRRIQLAARSRGAVSMGSEAFLQAMADALRPSKKADMSKPTDEPNPDYWLKRFGLNGHQSDTYDLDPEAQHWLREFGFEE